MCALVGMLGGGTANDERILERILALSKERGRDGYGFYVPEGGRRFIANFRAEPTTEYIKDKAVYDQQPYSLGEWTIVHNGTIANDKEIRTYQHPSKIDSAAIVELLDTCGFQVMIEKLRGSYAILALREELDAMYVAVNYQALWWAQTPTAIFFASARHFFPHDMLTPRPIEPYSSWCFRLGRDPIRLSPERPSHKRALVIASGGLDSTVAACALRSQGYEIELLHFMYGSRAEEREIEAIDAIAEHLDVKRTFIPLPIYARNDSPLLQKDSLIAGGEEGAEFAYEWVPARNLVMMSIATALAEAHGFSFIALGNNIEEAGAYPDNTQEFVARFADVLPYAVRDGAQVQILEPVGNLTKREIVELGHRLQAPIHLTWSCYRAGEHHCGTCGPCYMRRIAHEINGLVDPVFATVSEQERKDWNDAFRDELPKTAAAVLPHRGS